MKGQCSCGQIQYEMTDSPLFTHACHCKNCQRQTGTAHALNAMVESKCVNVISGETEGVTVETGSGMGQTIHRCPICKVAVWSTYAAFGEAFLFMRVGALEYPNQYPPDINIFTKSKQPWVTLLEGIPATEEFYDPKEMWPAASLQRMQTVMEAQA